MGRLYSQLSLEERCSIARLREAGQSIRQIAAALDRPPSTVSRELTRNSGAHVGYKPSYANEQAAARRWSGMRLERDAALRAAVLDRLRQGYSPEQVSGRLALEAGHAVISHESIYRFVSAQLRRTNNGGWRHYLPCAKAKRGRRGRRGGSPASFIRHRRSIHDRMPSARDRQEGGHWEADLMLFSAYGQALLAAHERSSRAILLARLPGKAAAPVADQLSAWLAPLPQAQRKTVTFDNGTEFSEHHRLPVTQGTYFCDVRAPWQKGGVENAIGRLRRYLPRKTDLDNITPDMIRQCAITYNNTPRKCLGYKTPAEAFNEQPLHFKCESTSRRSRG